MSRLWKVRVLDPGTVTCKHDGRWRTVPIGDYTMTQLAADSYHLSDGTVTYVIDQSDLLVHVTYRQLKIVEGEWP